MDNSAVLNQVPEKMDKSRRGIMLKLVDDRQKLIDGLNEIADMIMFCQDSPDRINTIILKTLKSIQ